jgi:hypothetical protein
MNVSVGVRGQIPAFLNGLRKKISILTYSMRNKQNMRVFARYHRRDKNVPLKARLSFVRIGFSVLSDDHCELYLRRSYRRGATHTKSQNLKAFSTPIQITKRNLSIYTVIN